MGVARGTYIVNDGLVFGYDTGYPVNSNNQNSIHYKGRPTTNLISGTSINIYNNRGADVSISNTVTSETYKGATVVKQTLTPITSAGVSYLTAGNNPGIGVVTSGGGGNANTYTGHSIFFKPTVPMHSSPIYTHYSNISGYQSTNQYEDMGDGWYRAHVIWYRSTSGSDGKYWAINPLTATLNQPITIYWAGPFKESLNVNAVSPYVHTSRSSTNSLVDLKKTSTINLSTVSFASTGDVDFDGTNDYIDIPTNFGVVNEYTFDYVVYTTVNSKMPVSTRTSTDFYKYGAHSWRYKHGGGYGEFYHNPGTANGWSHWTVTYDGSTINVYQNGSHLGAKSSAGTADFSQGLKIGWWAAGGSYAWNGRIPVMKMYNRALSDSEIQQNFTAYQDRFGL